MFYDSGWVLDDYLELEDTSRINSGGLGLGREDAVLEHSPGMFLHSGSQTRPIRKLWCSALYDMRLQLAIYSVFVWTD